MTADILDGADAAWRRAYELTARRFGRDVADEASKLPRKVFEATWFLKRELFQTRSLAAAESSDTQPTKEQ